VAKPKIPTKKLVVFAIAIPMIGFGVASMVLAHFGLAPLDITNTGLAKALHIQVGFASWISAATLLALAALLGRRPKAGTLVSVLFIGLSINTAIAILPSPSTISLRLVYLAAGLAVLYSGITLLVLAALGAGPSEELMLALGSKGAKIHHARWLIELALFVAGVALSGQVGPVTVLFVLTTGPILAWSIPNFAKVAKIDPPSPDPFPPGDFR